MKPQFLIAAPHSGAGKTTITLALLRALQRSGRRVQPFKCGPDYLDPQLHTIAAGQASINLDAWMMSETHLQELYQRYTSDAAISITEGVMGLFDGAHKMEGSSAALAALLRIPVILVVDARAMAYSAAALLYGYKHFFRDITLAGVIFNFVDAPSHYRILQEAAADVGVPVLGYLPERPDIRIPSRHLGLHTSAETDYDAIIDAAADHLSGHIDLELLLQQTLRPVSAAAPTQAVSTGRLKIAVAQDEAFHFIYPENITALKQLGDITYFSPLTAGALPNADLLYLPGGYPELHLPQLAGNTGLLQQLRQYKGRILAECGGMMYLGEQITDEKGEAWTMAGLLPVSTTMQPPRLSLGYREVHIGDVVLRGHEFHYSQYIKAPGTTQTDIRVLNSRQETVDSPVFHGPRILAGYMHFYWGDNIRGLSQLLGIDRG
ncbi:cobyrinate a,c-diamide synthase [Chitinophaga qingshengii]|uniref:Cobyrinate a,c-diamide synthase n=1 Tax=Chitinophaga qingshengii TaxID=1569794 RepID=A0ABR7TG27_9BACT|nr:cobyrinate a,c-diamide synthase [Chitinophaga qingshengii]MBC9929357.1 cobyrinate a,c-diamide synthase [Chitinophaga qingshengii]